MKDNDIEINSHMDIEKIVRSYLFYNIIRATNFFLLAKVALLLSNVVIDNE